MTARRGVLSQAGLLDPFGGIRAVATLPRATQQERSQRYPGARSPIGADGGGRGTRAATAARGERETEAADDALYIGFS
jgi:hypothetical protein